jgi:hypothetical protein
MIEGGEKFISLYVSQCMLMKRAIIDYERMGIYLHVFQTLYDAFTAEIFFYEINAAEIFTPMMMLDCALYFSIRPDGHKHVWSICFTFLSFLITLLDVQSLDNFS